MNIWREIEQDGAGLVEPDTPAGTERLLQRWLDLPAAARGTMAGRARLCFEARFEIRMAAEGLLGVLRAPSEETHTKKDHAEKSSHVSHPSRD